MCKNCIKYQYISRAVCAYAHAILLNKRKVNGVLITWTCLRDVTYKVYTEIRPLWHIGGWGNIGLSHHEMSRLEIFDKLVGL